MKAVRSSLLVVLTLCGHLMAVTNPVPFVNQPLVPDAATPGGSGFTLTVHGTGFASGAVINWNKSARSTTFVSSSQLTASILASDIATPGTAAVTVVNPGPGGGSSNMANFVVAVPSSDISVRTRHFVASKTLGVTAEIAGDFNGDGNQDLVVALNGYNGNRAARLAIYLGNGDGTFRRTDTIPIQVFAGNLVTGDFNRDGNLDLALITNLNQVSVLLGNGDGTFQAPNAFLTGINPVSIVAADFDRDGKLDLATSNSTDNTISILRGHGDGTFFTHVDTSTGGVTPYGLAVGDFNQDGNLDLAVTENASSEVTIMLGNGGDGFEIGAELFTVNFPGFVTAADLDGDGRLDLVVGHQSVSRSWQTLFLGKGDGTFQMGGVTSWSNMFPEQTATVADMNADGKLDLVVLLGQQNDGGKVAVALGDGAGSFRRVFNGAEFEQFFGFPDVAVTADFNNDGKIDVVTSDRTNLGGVTVLLQK